MIIDHIKHFDIAVLLETWCEEKDKHIFENELRSHTCIILNAIKTKRHVIPKFTFHRGGCFFALISIFTVFGRLFLHIHLLCMMGRFYFQTIIEFGVVTGCKVRK